jgi:hypothetical protein
MDDSLSISASVSMLVLLCASPVAWAGYEQGVEAFERRDCTTAFQQMEEAELLGDSRALATSLSFNRQCCLTPAPSEQHLDDSLCKSAEAGNAAAKFLVVWGRAVVGRDACGRLSNPAASTTTVFTAAEQGFPMAMAASGEIYEQDSQATDLVRAYAWYSLAARRGISFESASAQRVKPKLSAEELSRGDQLVEELDARIPRARMFGPSCSRTALSSSPTQ